MKKFLLKSDRTNLSPELIHETNSFQANKITIVDDYVPDPTKPNMIEPVSIIVTSTVAIIAHRIFEHWMRKKDLGVQIDLRTNPTSISNIENVPYGFIVIIDKDGKATTSNSTNNKSESFASLLSKIIK